MRCDRAADLHLVREVRQAIDAGGCAPPIIAMTERQQDQRLVEQQRAENLRRAEGSCPDAPMDPDWDGVKL